MTVPAWLHQLFADNPPGVWVDALGIAVVVSAAILAVRALLMRRFVAMGARTETRFNDAAVEVLRSIRRSYVAVFVTGVALLWQLDIVAGPVDRWLGRLIVLVAVLQTIRTGNRLVDFWVAGYASRRDGVDQTTLAALSYGARALLVVAVVLIGLDAASFRVGALLTGLGIGGVAIALALQNVLGDLFAAISIIVDKPFVVNDSIAVDQYDGTVEHIGLKTTRLRSSNGEQVVFSNADLLRSRVRNLTRREGRRMVFTVSVAAGTPAARLARVPAIVREVVEAEPRVRLQRAHLVGVGATGFDVEASFIVPQSDYDVAMDARQSILLVVYTRLEREGIALARPLSQPAAALPA